MHSLLKCNLLNVLSICNKLPELHQMLYGEAFDIILVTETWLKHTFPNSLIEFQRLVHHYSM